jgi:hypothetical protein
VSSDSSVKDFLNSENGNRISKHMNRMEIYKR